MYSLPLTTSSTKVSLKSGERLTWTRARRAASPVHSRSTTKPMDWNPFTGDVNVGAGDWAGFVEGALTERGSDQLPAMSFNKSSPVAGSHIDVSCERVPIHRFCRG